MRPALRRSANREERHFLGQGRHFFWQGRQLFWQGCQIIWQPCQLFWQPCQLRSEKSGDVALLKPIRTTPPRPPFRIERKRPTLARTACVAGGRDSADQIRCPNGSSSFKWPRIVGSSPSPAVRSLRSSVGLSPKSGGEAWPRRSRSGASGEVRSPHASPPASRGRGRSVPPDRAGEGAAPQQHPPT